MSEAAVKPSVDVIAGAASVATQVSIGQIFLEFLIIGATSFGGVVPYLRGSLVTKRHWVDDKEFVEMLSISQTLPGLNATNMAILVGKSCTARWAQSRRFSPSACRVLCLCTSWASSTASTVITSGSPPRSKIAAAAVGLILSTVVGLSKKSLAGKFDFVFIALTVIAVNGLHQSVPRTLIAVGHLAVLFHRPRKQQKESAAQ